MLRCGPPGKPSAGQIERAPEEMNGAYLADEGRAEFADHPVCLHELLPKHPCGVGIVVGVLIIFSERDGGIYLVGARDDPRLDAQTVQRREGFSVELGHWFGLQWHRTLASIAVTDDERLGGEVELHVENGGAVRDRAGRQPAWADVQGHLPPMVDQRHMCHANLAHDLDPHMQGVARWRPVVNPQRRPSVGSDGGFHLCSFPVAASHPTSGQPSVTRSGQRLHSDGEGCQRTIYSTPSNHLPRLPSCPPLCEHRHDETRVPPSTLLILSCLPVVDPSRTARQLWVDP